MPVLLSGRTRDYILCAVREYGPLIFILTSPTCCSQELMAIRPNFIFQPNGYRFDAATYAKLHQAVEQITRRIPLVCETAENEYLAYLVPEINQPVDDLYIIG